MSTSSPTKPLRVLIEAELNPHGYSGGVEQFLQSLVHALGKLNSPTEEYLILTHWEKPDWLKPFLGANQSIVVRPEVPTVRGESVKRLLGPLRRPLAESWRWTKQLVNDQPSLSSLSGDVPESNQFYESLGADVVHFPYQIFVRCSLPTVFNPHDLQHLHYPQFLPGEELARRTVVYRAGCMESTAVATESQWVKNDVVRQYGVEPSKVYVISRGSPTEIYADVNDANLAATRAKYKLPETFAMFPGQTWQHKNHLRLVEAVHRLRETQGLKLNLVCTGRPNSHFAAIESRIRELNLMDQVRFLGYVRPEELRALYRLCQFVVFPSLFEGGGFPVVEAFREGAPVTCSSVTSLTEYGGDAVLMFDPTSLDSIAAAMQRMASDDELRMRLRQRGSERVHLFNWNETAMAYRALYRKVAGLPLTRAEQDVLPLPCDKPRAVARRIRAQKSDLRVVHVSTSDRSGGAARAAFRLHDGLVRIGCNSSMFVMKAESHDANAIEFQAGRSYLHRFRRRWRRASMERDAALYQDTRPAGSELFSDARSIYGAEIVEQLPLCDVINLHWVSGFVDYPSFFAGLPPEIPVVWTFHDMNVFTGGCHYNDGCERFTAQCGACPQLGSRDEGDLSRKTWLLKFAALTDECRKRMHLVTPSRWMKHEVERSSLLKGLPVSVIPYGIDLDMFAPRDRKACRELMELPQDAKVILFTADWIHNKRKGLEHFAGALAGMTDTSGLAVISVGHGEPHLDSRIAHHHIGYVQNDRFLSAAYSAADVFVMPSLQDNLPNIAMESIACGTPVIAFDVGGVSDMVRRNLTGTLVPVGDTDALAAAISGVLSDEALRARMSAECRRVAREEYPIELQATRYAELYRTLLKK